MCVCRQLGSPFLSVSSTQVIGKHAQEKVPVSCAMGYRGNQSISRQWWTGPTKPGFSCAQKAPIISLSLRADRDAALAAATDKDATMAEYEPVEYAQGSAAAQSSCWKTWCDFQWARLRDDNFLPITSEKIRCISAMARRGSYRSWPNYLSQAKLDTSEGASCRLKRCP